MTDGSLQNKVVLVTGAGRGLGKAIALGLAAQGAKIVVNDINPDTAETTMQEIQAAGGEAIYKDADVANKMAVQTMHYEVLDLWGRVDGLVNNAAIEPIGPLLTLDEWAWDRVMNVNLKGVFLVTQTVARGMKEQGGGLVVNLGGAVTQNAVHAAFVSSKAGLAGLTQECAKEFAPYNIRVELVDPQADSQPEAIAAQVLKLFETHTPTSG
jgi:NAD(P)-dependent dehydrogenase (short-subunit alcohol dehydrogenase family)